MTSKDATEEGVCAGEAHPLRLECDACGSGIHVHQGPPFWFHDLGGGERYYVGDLPWDRDDDRVLLCWACKREARVVVEAGHEFVLELFHEARLRRCEQLESESGAAALHWSGDAQPGSHLADADGRDLSLLVKFYRQAQHEERDQKQAVVAQLLGKVLSGQLGDREDDSAPLVKS